MTKDNTSQSLSSNEDVSQSGPKNISLDDLKNVTGGAQEPGAGLPGGAFPPGMPVVNLPADGGGDNDPGLVLSEDAQNSDDPNYSVYEEESDV